MTNNISSDESGEDFGKQGSRRSSRRIGIGLATGLLAAVGLGLVIQSPISAARVSEAPTGAQLPWDDSTTGDMTNEGRSAGHNSMHDGSRRGGDGAHRHGSEHQHGQHGASRDGASRDGAAPDGQRPGGPRELIALAAKTLGMTPAELLTELKSGKSIADVASERDVPVQDVIDALVDEVVANASERITELVNRQPKTPGSDTPES